MKTIATTLLLTCATASFAQVFACKEANGNVTYSGTPCGPNPRVIDQNTLNRNNLDTSSVRRENARSEITRQRMDRQQQEASPPPISATNTAACPTDLQIRNLRVAANSATPSKGAGYRHAFAKRVQRECFANGGDVLSAEAKVREEMRREDEAARPLNCIFTHPGGGICH